MSRDRSDMHDADDHRDDDPLDDLVHAADLDGLVRLIDDRCASRDWAGLLRVRDRARAAVETGRQLWPAATLAEYRLALWATPDMVARVLDESDGMSGRFTVGPLTEVAAQHHTWDELAPHLDRGPRASFVAHERALRGEQLPASLERSLAPVLEIPLELQPWEPPYALAVYGDVEPTFDPPALPDRWVDLTPTHEAEILDDPDVELAVRQLVEPWTESSNGRAESICVEGDAAAAVGALGVRTARAVQLTPSEAIAWTAWAGASGGAHGRRRGAAAGRFGAWWLLAALGQFPVFPPDPDELGELATSLRWWRWDAHEPAVGWQLQLAVDDPTDGVAWAIAAGDARS